MGCARIAINPCWLIWSIGSQKRRRRRRAKVNELLNPIFVLLLLSKTLNTHFEIHPNPFFCCSWNTHFEIQRDPFFCGCQNIHFWDSGRKIFCCYQMNTQFVYFEIQEERFCCYQKNTHFAHFEISPKPILLLQRRRLCRERERERERASPGVG